MTDKNAQRLRNYLDTAHKSGVRLLHLSTDELECLLDELESAKKRIAELREWNVGLSQESFTHQQRIAEQQKEVELPRMAAIYWHLSDAAKHRTSEENILDVLEAIDAFRAAGTGKGEG